MGFQSLQLHFCRGGFAPGPHQSLGRVHMCSRAELSLFRHDCALALLFIFRRRNKPSQSIEVVIRRMNFKKKLEQSAQTKVR